MQVGPVSGYGYSFYPSNVDYGKTSTEGQVLKVPFATTVKLNKGMNKVLIEAKNMAGQTEQFTVMVNYK